MNLRHESNFTATVTTQNYVSRFITGCCLSIVSASQVGLISMLSLVITNDQRSQKQTWSGQSAMAQAPPPLCRTQAPVAPPSKNTKK